MNEAELVRRWRELKGRHAILVEGQAWDVAFPGRGPARAGPDFQGALFIRADGAQRRGDVEVHRLSSQWRAHGHHRDRAYNGVVLHVVERDDLAAPVTLEDGRGVPAAALPAAPGDGPPRPTLPWPRLAELLDRAGEARLEEKASRFQGEMAAEDPSQVLYRGLLGALGYSSNKDAFRQIADRLPLRRLRAAVAGLGPEGAVATAEALLLGQAGLLPSQRGSPAREPWERCLEEAWARQGEGAAPVSLSSWGRPGNHPARRLAGAARLLVGSGRRDLLSDMRPALGPGPPAQAGRRLTDILVVEAPGYWLRRAAPGLEASRNLGGLVGRGRAAEMVVNIVLPFYLAWAGREGAADLEAGCLEAYRSYPQLPDNGFLGRMRECLGLAAARLPMSARRQQGLLHLESTVCYQGGCLECPLPRAAG